MDGTTRPAKSASASGNGAVSAATRREVRRFYDQVGWLRTADDSAFEDGQRFDALRPETERYIHNCHLRVGEFLEREGDLFLDAASGVVQYPEYLEYSKGFRRRVCVDLSRRALEQARRRLGEHGLYVIADVSRLPFRPGSFRAGVSLSTIYHVAAGDQANAFRELARVAAPGGRIAVAYSWGKYSALMLLTDTIPAKFRQLLRRFRGVRSAARPGEPELYFQPQSPLWFRREVAPYVDSEMRVWRSVGVPFLRGFVPPGPLGRWLLKAIYAFENRFPGISGWLGQYPLIVLRGGAAARGRVDP